MLSNLLKSILSTTLIIISTIIYFIYFLIQAAFFNSFLKWREIFNNTKASKSRDKSYREDQTPLDTYKRYYKLQFYF